MTLADALNVTSMEGLLRFTWTVALLTFAIEGVGALIMGVRFAQDVGWAKGMWFGLFHAVSAFNNAGFALFSDNLMGYRGDLTINLVITTLIIAGGLGFFVLSGLLRLRPADGGRHVGAHEAGAHRHRVRCSRPARWRSSPSSGPTRTPSGRWASARSCSRPTSRPSRRAPPASTRSASAT